MSATADAMLEGVRNVPVQTAVARLGVGADPPFGLEQSELTMISPLSKMIQRSR